MASACGDTLSLPSFVCYLCTFSFESLLWLARPYSISNAPYELQLLPHVFVAQRITLRMRCESTLRADTALLDGVLVRLASALCDPLSSLVDTSDHLFLVLELGELRCDDTEYDVLVLGKVSKRLEASSTGCVVFEVVGIDVQILL